MTMDDAQFLATRQFQQLDIAAFFRVPIHRLGVVDRTTSLAGLEQLETSYLTGTLRPYLERIESYLSRQLPANLICKFDLSGRLRGDTSQRYAAYVQGWQTGFLNQDEIRAMEDLPPMPNGLGQTYYGPLNFAPLGTPPCPGQHHWPDGRTGSRWSGRRFQRGSDRTERRRSTEQSSRRNDPPHPG
jgi:hypothetical protein